MEDRGIVILEVYYRSRMVLSWILDAFLWYLRAEPGYVLLRLMEL